MSDSTPPPNLSGSAPLQEEGRRILSGFYAALRALKFYPLENVTVQQALDELHALVARLVAREGDAEIRVVGDFFFLNEIRLRLDLTNYATFGFFARALSDQGIGAVAVTNRVERSEWAPFLSLLLRAPGDDPYEVFLERLAATPVRSVTVRPISEAPDPEVAEEAALEAARRTYAQSVRAAQGALTDLRLGRAVNVRKVKRAVQGIIDQVLSNEPSIVAMTTLRDFDEYTFTHSVNVCIFSVVIGQRLGLDKHQLYELGLGALFHDVGKVRVPTDIINKPTGLSDEEWAILKEHPAEGLLILFHLHGFAEVPYRQMLMAYEHHIKIDGTGYPQSRRARKPGLFSRIVGVADGFDAGTSIRSYQYKPWAPDQVLREMRDNPRRGFDPLLVKALINATGVYPVGTLCILDSYELAVVAQANPDVSRLHQPRVKIIADSMGVPLSEPLAVDLSELDPATGEPFRSIIKTVNPEKYAVRVSDYVA